MEEGRREGGWEWVKVEQCDDKGREGGREGGRNEGRISVRDSQANL